MNVSISEIIVILLIALLVIQPKDMPGIAYKAGTVMRNMKRFFAAVKKDMNDLLDVAPSDKK